MNISELSIRRPVLATVLTIIILLFGLIGYNTLGVREYPSVDNPIISVTCSYHFVSQDARAQIDALVADVNIRAGNNPVDLFLPLAAERAADGISCHGPSPLTHIHFRENGAKPSGKEGISSLARTCYLFYRL